MALTGLRPPAFLRQGNLLYAELLRQAFVLGREEPPVTCEHLRGMAKALAMVTQQRREHPCIRRIAFGDHLPALISPCSTSA